MHSHSSQRWREAAMIRQNHKGKSVLILDQSLIHGDNLSKI